MAIDQFSDPVFDAIKERIDSVWTHTPVQWPNQEWNNAPDEPWVKVEYHGNLYGQMTVGAESQEANRWDRDGELWLYLSVPRGNDIAPVYGAALALANIFRGVVLLNGSLEFMDARVSTNPYASEVGAWFVVPVIIDWRHTSA